MWNVHQIDTLSQSTTRPIDVCPRLFDPVDEFLALDLGPLISRLHLDLFPVNKLPFLLLDEDQALLQLVTAQQDIKWHLVLLRRRKLCWQFRFALRQEICL